MAWNQDRLLVVPVKSVGASHQDLGEKGRGGERGEGRGEGEVERGWEGRGGGGDGRGGERGRWRWKGGCEGSWRGRGGKGKVQRGGDSSGRRAEGDRDGEETRESR